MTKFFIYCNDQIVYTRHVFRKLGENIGSKNYIFKNLNVSSQRNKKRESGKTTGILP